MAVFQGNDRNNTIVGTINADTILGYDGDDVLNGMEGNDHIFGGAGNDRLSGRDGDDVIDGGTGADDIFGGAGQDILFGGRGADADFLFGGEGIDTLYGGEGFDVLDGGAGRDVLIGVDPASGWTTAVAYTWGIAGVTVNLRDGFAIDEFGDRDTLINIMDVEGTDRNDTIIGDRNDNYFVGHRGNDAIFGGGGMDEVNYNTGGTQGIFANLFTGVVIDEWGDTDTLRSIEIIRATNFDDRIIGSAADEIFRGLGGDDIINGGGGHDEVWYDRDLEEGGFQGVEVNLAGGFATDGFNRLDSLISIEGARGSALADSLTGNDADNRLDGFFGDDTIFGGAGDDSLIGGQGADRINGGDGIDWVSYATDAEHGGSLGVDVNLMDRRGTDGFASTDILINIENVEGTAMRDSLKGDRGANHLKGLGGDDLIRGGDGNDTIEGGEGRDRMWGHGGRDTFVFGANFGRDRIEDFDATREILDFSGHGGVNGIDALTIRQAAGNTRITAGEDSILLIGVTATDIDADNFLF
jgi:Ca2+-binding RTX toxin-like protein